MVRSSRYVVVLAVVLCLSVAVPAPAIAQAEECSYPFTIEDASGTEVTIEEPPEEIVLMHANGAQIIQEIGAWDRVTGAPVAPFTSYLEDHDDPVDVTDDVGTPDREEIVNLSPDLVIAGHIGDEETVEALRADGLDVYYGEQPGTVDEIGEKVERYGALVDACDGANDTVDWMDERLDAIDADRENPPMVYYEIGGSYTAGDGAFESDMIAEAGGVSLGEQAGIEGWQTINAETIVSNEPDWIVYPDSFDELPVEDSVANTTNRTLAVDANHMGQAGPRVVLAIEDMARAFETTENATDAGDADEADSLPGFGMGIAGAAVVMTALIGRRL